MTQAEIDLPDGKYLRPDNRTLAPYTPGTGWGCIPSSSIAMLGRLTREQAKSAEITVGEVPPIRGEGRVMKGIGRALLIFAALYFSINLVIWWAKP